jgi:hypothetical protein
MEMENTQKGKIILYDSYFMTVVTYKAETWTLRWVLEFAGSWDEISKI